MFWEKGRKRMDADNVLAAMKPYQDGIADAIGVNDKRFAPATVEQERDRNGFGRIEVTITQYDPD